MHWMAVAMREESYSNALEVIGVRHVAKAMIDGRRDPSPGVGDG